jgi:hypothetical protein
MSVPSNLVPTRILQLPEDPSPSDTGWMMYVNNGVTYKVQVNAVLNVSGVPTTRAIIAGTGLTGGGTLASNVTISVAPGGIGATELDNTGVAAGVYGSSSALPILTVDANGRITAATTTPFSVSGYVPVTRQVIAGTGLTGGGALNANVTLSAVFSNSVPLALGDAEAGVANVSAREDHVHPAVDLASTIETTGVLGMVSGGTGVAHTAPAAGSVAYSDGSGIQLTTVGILGQVLVSTGAGAPDWGSALIVSDQPANYFYAGPTAGPSAPTTFRTMVNADLPASGVAANTYGSASSVPVFAVNSKGVVTSVTNTTIAIGNSNLANSAITINGNSVSLGGSTTVTATATNALTIGTGLSGTSYNGSSAVTIAIANTGVTAASVGSASKTLTATVNAQGQLTALADTNIAISNTQVSGLGSAALLTAGAAGGVATLDGGGTVPTSQLPAAVLGALKYQGTWNASTNTPTLASGVGTQGYYYVVSVAGTTNLDGITTWAVGDWAIYSGTEWQKIDNTDAVTSVNGYTGTVVLSYTDVGATPATSGTSILYGNGTGGTSNVTIGTGIAFAGGTLSATGLGGDVVGPASSTDNAIARFDLTTGKLLQNSTVTVTDNGDVSNANSVVFDITPTTLPTTQGTLYWDNADSAQTLSLVMEGGNAVQQIGQEQYFRIKCSAAVTEGQVVMFTGTVGASGGLTGAPATGLTASTASYVMGVATESGALNDWIYVTSFGLVRNINTTGGAESWVDGDILYYNPAVTGGLTKTLPTAPNPKVQIAAVVHAASNGSLFIRSTFGGILGQYEGDVGFTSLAANDLIRRNAGNTAWENVATIPNTQVSGLGTMSTQAASSVAITGGAINGTTIGGSTAAAGTFTTCTATSFSGIDGGTF